MQEFKPLQEVNFKLLAGNAKAVFTNSTDGNTYRGIFLPNGYYTPKSASQVFDVGGLMFVDDVGDICTLSVEIDAENIEILA